MEKELKMDRYTKPLLMTCIDMDAIATADPVVDKPKGLLLLLCMMPCLLGKAAAAV